MDTRICISIISGVASVAYFNHEELNSVYFSERRLARRYLLTCYGPCYYVVYSYEGVSDYFAGNCSRQLKDVKSMRLFINSLCTVWRTHYEKGKDRQDKIVIAKYEDSDFTKHIGITIDDPIFTPSKLVLSDELRAMTMEK